MSLFGTGGEKVRQGLDPLKKMGRTGHMLISALSTMKVLQVLLHISTTHKGSVAGFLCLVGPDFRLSEERIEQELDPKLQKAAQAASAKMGFRDHSLSKP